MSAELRRQRAFVDADLPTIVELLSPGLKWIHGDSTVDSAESLCLAIESEKRVYRRIVTSDTSVSVYSDLAVIGGIVAMTVMANGVNRVVNSLFTALYEVSGGPAQLALWQSTPIQIS